MEALVLFKRYNQSRLAIEAKFSGLPHTHTTLIKSMITLADPATGIVSNISYNYLGKLLTVNSAPGRKDTGTPEKPVIRSYLRTIEKQCGEHFEILSEHQQLKFRFPHLPAIYAEHLDISTDVSTLNRPQETIQRPLIDTRLPAHFGQGLSAEESTEVSTEQYTPAKLVKNIFILNKNKHNKQTNIADGAVEFSKHQKRLIHANFYPTPNTITTALSMGLTKVTDTEEIQSFIQHNTTQRTQWADFNPVFITWLEREVLYTQQKQRTLSKSTGSYAHERYQHQVAPKQTALERISQHHGIAISSLWDAHTRTLPSGESVTSRFVMSMDEAHRDLRTIVHQ